MRKEWLARFIVIMLGLAAIAIPVWGRWARAQGTVLHARMAETGGWTPESLIVEAGQPLNLRLTSDDVTHSFAIGQSDLPPVDVIPGEMTELTLTFDQPGKYTYYCTRWCGVNHWRMRGTIEVTGPDTEGKAAEIPLYLDLGLDIDAAHQAETVPGRTPSAGRANRFKADLPKSYQSREYYLSHSPADLWQALREEPSLNHFNDQEIWDLVALIWQANTTSQELSEGEALYATNCAACHGETGSGDGVFAEQLDLSSKEGHSGMQSGEMTTRPADFSDPLQMLSASPAHLQGKILRGGMGTGMPYWGPIFTDEQTWAVIAYLYTFQFDLEDRP